MLKQNLYKNLKAINPFTDLATLPCNLLLMTCFADVYCSVTEAHVCEQLDQGRYRKARGRGSNARPSESQVQRANHRGVATGWTGVDMSTPLLPDVAPENDTNPTSLYRGRGRGSVRSVPPPDPRYRLALRSRHVCPPCLSLCPPHIF